MARGIDTSVLRHIMKDDEEWRNHFRVVKNDAWDYSVVDVETGLFVEGSWNIEAAAVFVACSLYEEKIERLVEQVLLKKTDVMS